MRCVGALRRTAKEGFGYGGARLGVPSGSYDSAGPALHVTPDLKIPRAEDLMRKVNAKKGMIKISCGYSGEGRAPV